MIFCSNHALKFNTLFKKICKRKEMLSTRNSISRKYFIKIVLYTCYMHFTYRIILFTILTIKFQISKAPSKNRIKRALKNFGKPQKLSLGELRCFSCLLQTVFPSFLHSGISRQKACSLQNRFVFRICFTESSGNAMP